MVCRFCKLPIATIILRLEPIKGHIQGISYAAPLTTVAGMLVIFGNYSCVALVALSPFRS